MGLVTHGFVLSVALWREPASPSPGWGQHQFNLHASETSPLNKIKCFPTPAWCSAHQHSSPSHSEYWCQLSQKGQGKRRGRVVNCPPGNNTGHLEPAPQEGDHPINCKCTLDPGSRRKRNIFLSLLGGNGSFSSLFSFSDGSHKRKGPCWWLWTAELPTGKPNEGPQVSAMLLGLPEASLL